jgi:hypothetical protein
MSTIKLSSITNKAKTSGPVIVGVTSSTAEGYAQLASGTNADRVGIESGSIRYNETAKLLEFYDGETWNFIIPAEESANALGVFGGGRVGRINSIEYLSISTLGNSEPFGALTVSDRYQHSSVSSSTRGVFGGGYIGPQINTIEYITFTSKGNSSNFGQLNAATGKWNMGSCSSSTRGLFGGGFSGTWPGTIINVIDYITIATTGNAFDFGDLFTARQALIACSSSTRGVFGGGITQRTPTAISTNAIDFITIASQGTNASTFGALSQPKWSASSCSSSTRGIFSGGRILPSGQVINALHTIEYVTIATTGNSIYFGDLTQARATLAACSSSTRGVFGAGYFSGPDDVYTNLMDYITISTTGNAKFFGGLTKAEWNPAACSNNHGGLL